MTDLDIIIKLDTSIARINTDVSKNADPYQVDRDISRAMRMLRAIQDPLLAQTRREELQNLAGQNAGALRERIISKIISSNPTTAQRLYEQTVKKLAYSHKEKLRLLTAMTSQMIFPSQLPPQEAEPLVEKIFDCLRLLQAGSIELAKQKLSTLPQNLQIQIKHILTRLNYHVDIGNNMPTYQALITVSDRLTLPSSPIANESYAQQTMDDLLNIG